MKHFIFLLVLTTLAACLYPGGAFAASSGPAPSDANHPVVMEQAAEQVASAALPPLKPFQSAPNLQALSGSGGLQREVFGFALASSLSDPTVGYPSWQFSLLTTVAFFGLHVQNDGTFASDSGAAVWNSSQLTGLLSAAHGSGAKVVLTIILQDFTAGTPNMCSGLANRANTVRQTVAEVAAKGVDGVNIDYEGLNGTCANGQTARSMMTDLAAQLRAQMPLPKYLSVDTYASSAGDPGGFFDIPGLSASVDSFFVMAYDSEYSNYRYPPTSCATFCLGPTAPLTGYRYNDTTDASQYLGVVAASKVILGVPYYGRKACVASATPNQTPQSSVIADSYLDAIGEAGVATVRPGSYTVHRDANDPAGQERWDTWYNTSIPCTRELYWDDVASLGLKYDLVNADNLRGVGLWNLNFGGGSPELWNLLAAKFATNNPWTSLGGALTSGPDASSWGSSRADVFVRGNDNGLYHRFWDGGQWNGWDGLGGTLTSDPGAVSWGPDRIDVFVRGNDNGLYHRWGSGNGIWYGWQPLGGYLTSAPDVAAWSAGRLDVFVRGADNGLWHKWWDGQNWSGWQPLGGVLTSDPTVVSWGPNRIDVFVRGTDNGLWHLWWDGAAWNGWQPLGGSLTSGPDASSCASGHLDVFAQQSGSNLNRLGYNGAWSAWQPLGGGPWTSDPSAVCRVGTNSIDLFERGQDGALWRTFLAAS
jgi:spore germination protein YaaH